MIKLSTYAFDLPLRHPFRIAYKETRVQRTMIVELRDGELCGYGEATENSYYGVTVASMTAALEGVREAIEGGAFDHPAELWGRLCGPLRDQPFALCAVDEAAHDLWGKRHGEPTYRLLGLDRDPAPLSNYTIGLDTPQRMAAKMAEVSDWPIYKIKLGSGDVEGDLERVRELRRHSDAVFRVDANGGWSPDEALRCAAALAELGVEFIEQPLGREADDAMPQLRRASPLPLIADESCITEDDVERCAGRFDGVNIKLMKAGGMTAARRMIDRARALGMTVMIGCMTESTVGISAIAQLLPLLDDVDMDGAALLAGDIADGVSVVRGEAIFPARPGHGVVLTAEPTGADDTAQKES